MINFFLSDDIVGIIIGIFVVMLVYSIVHIVVKKRDGHVGWKPDWLTPLILFLAGILVTIVFSVINGSTAVMIPILLAFGIVPTILLVIVIKSIVVFVF